MTTRPDFVRNGVPLGPDDVADVEGVERRERLLADGILAHVELDLPRAVPQVGEIDVSSHLPAREDAARDGDALAARRIVGAERGGTFDQANSVRRGRSTS